MDYLEALNQRRSEYALSTELPVPEEEVVKLVRDIISVTPSSYNGQSPRAFILFGDDHKALWKIVEDSLVAKIGPERYQKSKGKIDGFANAAGTILYYEDDSVTKKLQEDNLSYHDTFPVWAEQANGMLQFAVWSGLRTLGIGANLQHYNPLIDQKVKETFGIPDGYRLISQMPFGKVTREAPRKPRLDPNDTVKVAHARV